MEYHRGILINKIPATGIGGMIFALGTVAIFAIGIPEIRQLMFVTLPVSGLVASLLYYWHNQTRW